MTCSLYTFLHGSGIEEFFSLRVAQDSLAYTTPKTSLRLFRSSPQVRKQLLYKGSLAYLHLGFTPIALSILPLHNKSPNSTTSSPTPSFPFANHLSLPRHSLTLDFLNQVRQSAEKYIHG